MKDLLSNEPQNRPGVLQILQTSIVRGFFEKHTTMMSPSQESEETKTENLPQDIEVAVQLPPQDRKNQPAAPLPKEMRGLIYSFCDIV